MCVNDIDQICADVLHSAEHRGGRHATVLVEESDSTSVDVNSVRKRKELHLNIMNKILKILIMN